MSRQLLTVVGVTVVAGAGVALQAFWAQSGNETAPALPRRFQLPKPIRPADTLETVKATTREYLDRAASAAHVQCTGRRVDFGPGGNIFTFYTFETREMVKGSEQRTITIRLLGGTIGNTTIPLPIDPEFVAGAEYLLMLGQPNADGYATLNPAAVFSVKLEPESGRRVAVPGGTGLTFYSRATGRQTVSSPDWTFLDDFIYSLKRAAQ